MEHTNDQAQPTEGFDSKVVIPEVQKDIDERRKKGIKTYGTELKTFNGRNALVDAYQEALDLAIYLKQALMEEECELEEDSPPRIVRYERLNTGDIFFYNDCVYVKFDKHSAGIYQTDITEHGFTGDEQVIVDSTFVEPFYEEHGAISEERREIIDTALIYGNEDYSELLSVEENYNEAVKSAFKDFSDDTNKIIADHLIQQAKEDDESGCNNPHEIIDRVKTKYPIPMFKQNTKEENNVLGVKERLREYWADQYRKDKEEVQAWVQYCKDLEESRKEPSLQMEFISRDLLNLLMELPSYEPLEDKIVFTDGTESYR